MPGFGGFAAVPEGYNEAEKNQQIVQALILDLQQKQAQQQAIGLAFNAFSRGAGMQPGSIPGASPFGGLPPTQTPQAPGLDTGGPPASTVPGAPVNAGMPGGTPAPTGATGMVPGQGTGVIGTGKTGTLRELATNRYPGNQQTAQAINYVANALGVSPDQQLTESQVANANQLFPNLDPGGGIVPPTTAAPGQVQQQPLPPPAGAPGPGAAAAPAQPIPVRTASIPGATATDATPPPPTAGGGAGVPPPAAAGAPAPPVGPSAGLSAPPPGVPANVPIPQGRPAGMGPGVVPGQNIGGVAAGGAGVPRAAPPPAAGGPPAAGAPARAPQPGRQALSWQDSVNWINQEADRQEQQTGRKISPQQRWMALQQMLPFMTEDAKAQHEQALADLKKQQADEIARYHREEESRRMLAQQDRETHEEHRHSEVEQNIEIRERDLDRKRAELQERMRKTDIDAAQKAQNERDKVAIEEEKRQIDRDRLSERATHDIVRDENQRLGITTRADTADKDRASRAAIAGKHDESAERRTQAQIAGRLQGLTEADKARATRQDKELEARLQRTMMSGSPSAQVMRKWLAEHKDATDAEVDAKLRSLPTAGGAALAAKERVAIGSIQSVEAQIERAIKKLEDSVTSHHAISGIGGTFNRWKEWGTGAKQTPASVFETDIETLKKEIPRAISGIGKLSSDERKGIDKIVRGLSPFVSAEQSINSLNELLGILRDKLQREYGVSPGDPNVDPPPPEIVPYLKKGKISTFDIGGEKQFWTIDEGGQPMRVEDPGG